MARPAEVAYVMVRLEKAAKVKAAEPRLVSIFDYQAEALVRYIEELEGRSDGRAG